MSVLWHCLGRRPAALRKSTLHHNLIFFWPSESRAVQQGTSKNKAQAFRPLSLTPIHHWNFVCCTYSTVQKSRTWVVRQGNECVICMAWCLTAHLRFCPLCRREGGGDEGEPETLHHGAREGVWRAGYSLQLHQDCHCQEWVSTDTWKKHPKVHAWVCVQCPHAPPGDRCHLFTVTHTHTHNNLSFLLWHADGSDCHWMNGCVEHRDSIVTRSWWNTTYHRSAFPQHSHLSVLPETPTEPSVKVSLPLPFHVSKLQQWVMHSGWVGGLSDWQCE